MNSLRLLIIAVLALAGAAVSAYLLTVHWGWWSAVCLGVGDCQAVNTSRYSEFLGVPVAAVGIGAYIGIFFLSMSLGQGVAQEWSRRALFVIAASGVAFSVYLTYIEVFVLYEICPWCVLSALIIVTIAILSALELYEPQNIEAT